MSPRALQAVESGRAIKAAEKAIANANYETEHAGDPTSRYGPGAGGGESIAVSSLDAAAASGPRGIVDADLARQLRIFTSRLSEVRKKQALMKRHGVTEQLLDATETDSSFNLRCQNYEQMVADTIKREDPLKKLAVEM